MGRACGGLCASCQRMYDFQSERLNFDFEALKPKESWDRKLRRLMRYFEEDAQLRDILITGGDALMSQNATLRKILEAVYKMAETEGEREPFGGREVRRAATGTARFPVAGLSSAACDRRVGRYIEGVQGEGFRYRCEPVLYTNAFPVSTGGDTGGEARYRGDLGGGLDDHESVGLYGLGFP